MCFMLYINCYSVIRDNKINCVIKVENTINKIYLMEYLINNYFSKLVLK